jgi:sugar phosphate isomerase/epimerase
MRTPLLSTMWAQQPRFAGAGMASFAAVARDAGYSGIEVSHSTDEAGLEVLLTQSLAPVRSLHAPAPRAATRRGVPNGDLNLAALDEDERAEAVAQTARTIAFAARAGARTVVVHLGAAGRSMLEPEARLRRLFAAGRIDSDEARAAREEAHRLRGEIVAPYLTAARRSLAELVEIAVRHGVILGLENRLHFHEIPNAEETAKLLADYPLEAAGYWHDTGHAEVQGRLGLIDPRAALAALAHRLVGAHLHDVRGVLDHRAPGTGDVDWGYIAVALPPAAIRTLEIDQREPEPLLSEALRFLREQGVLEGQTADGRRRGADERRYDEGQS